MQYITPPRYLLLNFSLSVFKKEKRSRYCNNWGVYIGSVVVNVDSVQNLNGYNRQALQPLAVLLFQLQDSEDRIC